jgi:hypothetical protein
MRFILDRFVATKIRIRFYISWKFINYLKSIHNVVLYLFFLAKSQSSQRKIINFQHGAFPAPLDS